MPGLGVQKTKVEAWTVLGADGTRALHLMALENVTSMVRRVAREGEGFTGDAEGAGGDVTR